MTFYIYSLGCKVNSYECASISSKLLEEGFTYDSKNPDIIIINTCSVTHVADQKSRQHIRKFRNKYPSSIIVVMGCYAQANSEFIKDELKADIVIGTSHRDEIVDYIKEYLSSKKGLLNIDKDIRQFDYEELGITSYSENIRAYLKIQDGCDNFCTYCIIPYRRGRSRSRDISMVIEEAKQLVAKGYKEIVLTGVHIGKFGQDNGSSFSALVEELCKIEDLFRLRISSIEESEIDDKLIHLIATNDKIAKHLHIPLQSGSDKTLKRMARKYDSAAFMNKINKIKELLPDVCLTTDFIVGFPGETDEDFLDSFNFLKKVGFVQVHTFPYSVREGTPAASFKDQIAPNIKHERELKVLAYSTIAWEDYSKSFDNKEVEVIIEKYDEDKKRYYGHSSNYLDVYLEGDNYQVGDIVKTIYKYA